MAEYLKTEEMSSYIKNIENEVIIFRKRCVYNSIIYLNLITKCISYVINKLLYNVFIIIKLNVVI